MHVVLPHQRVQLFLIAVQFFGRRQVTQNIFYRFYMGLNSRLRPVEYNFFLRTIFSERLSGYSQFFKVKTTPIVLKHFSNSDR